MTIAPLGATLLAEETTTDEGWRCITTVWVAGNSTYGARILASNDADLRREAERREDEGLDDPSLDEAEAAANAASVLAISEGVASLAELELSLSRDIAPPMRRELPSELLESSVAKALLRARLTQRGSV